MRRRPALVAAITVAGMALTACTVGSGSTGGPGTVPGGSVPSTATAPTLAVSEVVAGLEHAWDIGFLPDGALLVTERPGRLSLVSGTDPGATRTVVEADLADVGARGEGGLMGLLVHPDFASSRRFTTCQTHAENDRLVDVRLVTWELSADRASARRVRDPLVGGLPVASSGRHSGCRPTLAPDGSVLVGTGDTARAAVPQDRTSLGGKVLRIDLATGGPAPGNPYETSADGRERLVWTYGHRNVQGVAIRPDTGQAFSTEHGPSRDDEVNLLQAAGNYGWDPSQGGTVSAYDESVPMTDTERFPDAIEAVWSSGGSTEAICAAVFLSGSQWGPLDGVLAVTTLKASKLLLMTLGPDAAVTTVSVPAELDGSYGRLRAARLGPDGDLYVTTSNGDDDKVLRIGPRS
ncbi:MAG TPA: PQQ-dependent sugar dehydrogenase [Pseudonocardiaceae bacterium]